jgi:hypothetical protein
VRALGGLLVALVAAVSCAAGATTDARYPARAEGCSVRVFEDAPNIPTDNLGPVKATCSADVSDADCLRTLEDQVCRLGGDVVWGVPPQPSKTDAGSRWSGRAAHTKATPSSDAGAK